MDTAKRLVESPYWQWSPGMMAVVNGVRARYTGHNPRPGSVPDLSDRVTVGLLLMRLGEETGCIEIDKISHDGQARVGDHPYCPLGEGVAMALLTYWSECR